MPKLKLETDRLIMTPLNQSHASALFKLNQDDQVIHYTGDSAFGSISEAEQFLINYKQFEKNQVGRFACQLKSNHQFIGWCGLRLNQSNTHGISHDLGFRFLREFWGQGYATESAKLSIEYGFEYLNIPQIYAQARTENLASLKVLKRLGFSFWKHYLEKGLEFELYHLDRKLYLERKSST